MTFTEALILARDEGYWIRSMIEGQVFRGRWMRRVPGSRLSSLSYVWEDRTAIENRSFNEPRIGTIDILLGEWEAIPDPTTKKTKR